MNLFEYCERYHISVAKARRQMKDGVLRLDREENEQAAQMRFYLGRGQHLTLAHMVALLENSSILLDLGRYEERAEAQLAELGDVKGAAAPREVAAHITDARSGKEPESIAILVAWLRSVIPTHPVSHYWVALRLLWGLPENIRKYDVPRVPLALLQCRKHPDLAGWWRVVESRGRTQTIYQRPEKPFDL
jgi:hypothetical protein